MFDRKGYIAIVREDLDVDEDQMFEDVIEAGAEDLQTSDEVFEIYTEPKIFEDVRDALQAKYDLDSAEITIVRPYSSSRRQGRTITTLDRSP